MQNAVVDALSHLGVRHLDMPCTPERVWRAIEDAKAGTLADPWREPPAAFATLTVRERGAPKRRPRPTTSTSSPTAWRTICGRSRSAGTIGGP